MVTTNNLPPMEAFGNDPPELVHPVSNKVEDSEGPPNFCSLEYAPEKIGPYPLPVFPAGSEAFKP